MEDNPQLKVMIPESKRPKLEDYPIEILEEVLKILKSRSRQGMLSLASRARL